MLVYNLSKNDFISLLALQGHNNFSNEAIDAMYDYLNDETDEDIRRYDSYFGSQYCEFDELRPEQIIELYGNGYTFDDFIKEYNISDDLIENDMKWLNTRYINELIEWYVLDDYVYVKRLKNGMVLVGLEY